MATAERRLMEWLRDAHAIEAQAEVMLGATARRIENYPDLKARLEQHLEETHHQEELVRGCIERRGSNASVVKDATARVVAWAQGATGLFVGDEIIKASLALYTFEHMEIASYKILAAAADRVGDTETKHVCENILREEEAMAAWLEVHLSETTQQYLAREEMPGAVAKH